MQHHCMSGCQLTTLPCASPTSRREEPWKVLLVGDEQVGKSSLVRCFHGGKDAGGAAAEFSEALPPTFSVDFVEATVEIPDGGARALHVYDTPGRADFAHGIRSYYRGMHGVMIVVDLTSAASLEGAERWLAEVSSHVGLEQGARHARCVSPSYTPYSWRRQHTCLLTQMSCCSRCAAGRRNPNQVRRVLIGSKADLARGPTGESLRQVGYEEARSWAAERCMSYVEVSAKTGMNITAALLTMVSEIAEAATDKSCC